MTAHDDLQFASQFGCTDRPFIADSSFVKCKITGCQDCGIYVELSMKSSSRRLRRAAHSRIYIYLIVQMLKHIHGTQLSSVQGRLDFAAAGHGHGACSYTSLKHLELAIWNGNDEDRSFSPDVKDFSCSA
jgi:hypothetical protein